MAIVLNPSSLAAWLLAAYAGSVGAWSRTAPARRPSTMFIRASLLLAGAFILQVDLNAGGPSGAYAIVPVMVTAVYSLLLPGRWVLALWGVAGVAFLAAHAVAGSGETWQLALAQAGVLAFFAHVARDYATSARELDQQAEFGRRDRDSRLYNEAGFFSHGGQLFDDCRDGKRPFSMVLLNSADLREVSQLAGKKAANQLFDQLVRRIDAATPPGGLAARTDAVEFGMVLPGLGASRAAALLQQQLGQPPKIEVTVKGTRLTVMLDAVTAEATPDVPSLEDMYDRLRNKLMSRAGDTPSMPSDMQSTLQGMLESDPVIPRDARPTVPMTFATDADPGRPARQR